ncbi:TetR/AcrR family transcriptional regulator [Phenylobacterium sp.]|uniref:TetR/AcrR family transcriptional regulator n=1 Tax=Phenylobacterium sp. TaxID=1871053 RepID=UPI002FD9591B
MEMLRKPPLQDRAQVTVDTILEAAAQLLELRGEVGFNTNAVAERAGVSIGTLYRYFPDKQALMLALADRESHLHGEEIQRLLAARPADMALDRALIRAFIGAFAGRRQARRIAMAHWFAHAPPEALAGRYTALARALCTLDEGLTPLRAFVLTRSLHGVLRAAVLEDGDLLTDPAFEDEVVRLSRAYLAAAPSP